MFYLLDVYYRVPLLSEEGGGGGGGRRYFWDLLVPQFLNVTFGWPFLSESTVILLLQDHGRVVRKPINATLIEVSISLTKNGFKG